MLNVLACYFEHWSALNVGCCSAEGAWTPEHAAPDLWTNIRQWGKYDRDRARSSSGSLPWCPNGVQTHPWFITGRCCVSIDFCFNASQLRRSLKLPVLCCVCLFCLKFDRERWFSGGYWYLQSSSGNGLRQWYVRWTDTLVNWSYCYDHCWWRGVDQRSFVRYNVPGPQEIS